MPPSSVGKETGVCAAALAASNNATMTAKSMRTVQMYHWFGEIRQVRGRVPPRGCSATGQKGYRFAGHRWMEILLRRAARMGNMEREQLEILRGRAPLPPCNPTEKEAG